MPFSFSIEWDVMEDEIEQSDDAEIHFTVTADVVDDEFYATNAKLVIELDAQVEFLDVHPDEPRRPTQPLERIGISRTWGDDPAANDEWKERVSELKDMGINDLIQLFQNAGDQQQPLIFELGIFMNAGDFVTKGIMVATGRTLGVGAAYSGAYTIPCRIDYDMQPRQVPPQPGTPQPLEPLVFIVEPD